ncbi:uncharacterized protein FA14DRAFT_117210 [Meira miltonrushii]|uniref:Mannosyltransferase n=1 Tax=Meira miltonrushii TaxID=1280837 RepID=A0A316VJ63_9BASI|nr:uncharacterized protein FA14DRAFT_117210 [Meira miltonrushii]PWN37652.1 hypothetical protein FA14DRAFT_117210 [Meira miltonrushii]
MGSVDYPTPTTSETGERARVPEDEREHLKTSTPVRLLQRSEEQFDNYLWWRILAFRIINAFITSRTVSAPDEHWQSLEIAHKIVFGYGWTTWEWIDRRPADSAWFGGSKWGDGPIRSALHPVLFVPLYWVLAQLRLDSTWLLTIAPSLLQAVFATYTDWFAFRLTRRILNERSAWATLLVSFCSMYTFHSTTRTLSNSLEASLSMAAIFYWPLSLPEDSDTDLISEQPLIEESRLIKSVTLFAISAALRPSNVLLSFPLLLFLIRAIVLNINSPATALEAAFALLIVLRTVIYVFVVAVISLFTIDSIFYQRLTFTPLGFLKRNVLQGISLFYGASPVHFYLTSALPFIGFTLLPFALRGLWFAFDKPPTSTFDKITRRWEGVRGERDPKAMKTLADSVIVFVLAMSLLGHKEVRFLQPIVPVIHMMQAYALVITLVFDRMRDVIRFIRVWHGEAALWLLALNLVPIFYLSIHSIGQVRVAEYVGQLQQSGSLDSVGFIMPCHSTPWMSHIHSQALAEDPKKAWFITCEPPLDANVVEMKTYKDESDYFYDDPIKFLRKRIGTQTRPWPSHLVMFEALLQPKDGGGVAQLLSDQGYTQKRSFWNSVFHPDHRRRGRVIVMEKGQE